MGVVISSGTKEAGEGTDARTGEGNRWRELPEGAFGAGRQPTQGFPAGGELTAEMPPDLCQWVFPTSRTHLGVGRWKRQGMCPKGQMKYTQLRGVFLPLSHRLPLPTIF